MVTRQTAPCNRIVGRGVGRVLMAVRGETGDMIQRMLRRIGWKSLRAESAAELRHLLCETTGKVTAVIGTDLADESGWLTCAKLRLPPGRIEVLIVGPDTPRHRMMARVAGAAAIFDDPAAIADWLPPAGLRVVH